MHNRRNRSVRPSEADEQKVQESKAASSKPISLCTAQESMTTLNGRHEREEQEWNEAGGLVWFAGYDILLCMPSASKSISFYHI